MARLVYDDSAAQQWPSWVAPLQPLCGGTAQQLEHLKLSLLRFVNLGTLEAFGTFKEHLVLQFAADKQASDVRRFLTTACQKKLEVQSLDPLHIEQFGWTPPEELYKQASELFKEASEDYDFAAIRRMFPGMAHCEDEELDISRNVFLLPALEAALNGITQPAIEDCAHELSGNPRLEHIVQRCCEACEGVKKRRRDEVRWFCERCGAVWCNQHALPHRSRQQDRWQVEDTIKLFKQPEVQQHWYPRAPCLKVRSGCHLSTERKIEWIVFREPFLVNPLFKRCLESLPHFYKTYVTLFKQYCTSHERNLQQQALDCFRKFMQQTQPDFPAIVVKNLPLDLRCEVESITKGHEVRRCVKCKKEPCNCRRRYCGRLGQHQDAECERKKRIEQERRNPRRRRCPYQGELMEVLLDRTTVFSPLLPIAPPHILEQQSRVARDKYRQRCLERGEECLLVGWEEAPAAPSRKPVKPLELEKNVWVKGRRCPECRALWWPPSSDTVWPGSSAGSA